MYKFRPWTIADVDALWTWVQDDPRVVDWLGTGITSSLDVLSAIVRLSFLEYQQLAVLCAVEEDDALIGFVGAFPILPDHSAFVHVVLAPEKRGHGRDVLRQAISEANRLGLDPLFAMFGVADTGLYMLAESLGFKEETKTLVLRTR